MATASTQAAVGKSRGLSRILSREFQLLLACCSQQLEAESNAQFRTLLSHEIDWTRFLELLEKHGVLPLAQPYLTSAKDVIPNEVLSEVQRRSADHVRRALALTQLLYRVTRALEEAGVPALPYKGPVLAQRLYGDIATRQYSDLDFLVMASDVDRAKAVLGKSGFLPHRNLRPAEEMGRHSSGYELTLDGLRNRNVIEIQWRVVPRFYSMEFQLEEFFSAAQIIPLDGGAVQTLCDEDLVLALCAHAAKHAWSKLSWICDIARLSSMPGTEWPRVRQRAQTLGIQRIVGISFFLARELLGASVPTELEAFVSDDRQVPVLGKQIAETISESELDPESIAYFYLMLRTRERLRDQLRFIWRLVSTPTESEWSLIELPELLFPLYRVVRLLRLAARLLGFSSKRVILA